MKTVKKIKIAAIVIFGLYQTIILCGFIDDELAQKDMPNILVNAYTENKIFLKSSIRQLCLVLNNARNGIAYRDYARKEQKYGREETHTFLLDVSLVALENGHPDDLSNAAEYCAQIPKPETDYTIWSKDYAQDFIDSAMIIRAIADELDWDPSTTKGAIKDFWTKQRQLQKKRKGNQGQGNNK